MFAYFSKIKNKDIIDIYQRFASLFFRDEDSDDDEYDEDDEYLFNNYTIVRWANEYNIMFMHPTKIVVRENIPPLFSYS
jgi:hypothetical protein